MLVGGILGLYAIPVPFVEIGIALSVLLLGLAIAFDRQLPLLFAMAFVGVFAIFHGHAHGAEMPELASPVLYALGFMWHRGNPFRRCDDRTRYATCYWSA